MESTWQSRHRLQKRERERERKDSLLVYRISKVLTGGFTGKTTVVKDKARKVPTKDIDQRNKKLIG